MRIKGIDPGKVGLWTRLLFNWLRRRQGRVSDPLRAYAYRPAILWGFLRLARVIRRRGVLDPRLKGLAMYWTARNVDCAF